MNEKLLSNITDVNVSKHKDATGRFIKLNHMFKESTKADKNMNDILQGVQMQNNIPYAIGVHATLIRVFKSTPENPLILSASVDVH